jgi:ferredoxin
MISESNVECRDLTPIKKIYFFTGTGNSLFVAEKLAELIDGFELVAIKDEMKKENIVIDCDVAGIIYPVYCFGLPRIVRDFLVKADFSKVDYVFSVATAGNPKSAPSNIQLAKILKKKNKKLSGGFVVGLPGNYIPLYGAPSDEKQQKYFNVANERVSKIADYIKQKKAGYIEKGFFLLRFGYLGANFFYMGLKNSAKKFHVTDKCTSCGLCEKVCPVGNIKLVNDLPVWSDKCEQCMACLQLCPVEAIEYGKISMGRRRYKNPFVKLT